MTAGPGADTSRHRSRRAQTWPAGRRRALRGQLACFNRRSLNPSTRRRSDGGRSSTKQSIASTISRHCASPVMALSEMKASLHLAGHADAQLRVILHPLTEPGAGGRTARLPPPPIAPIARFLVSRLCHVSRGWCARLRWAHSAAIAHVSLQLANRTIRGQSKRDSTGRTLALPLHTLQLWRNRPTGDPQIDGIAADTRAADVAGQSAWPGGSGSPGWRAPMPYTSPCARSRPHFAARGAADRRNLRI
jgi:hypothetical protein